MSFSKTLVLFFTFTFVQFSSASLYDVAENSEVLSFIGQPKEQQLRKVFSLVTWNIQKAEDENDWAQDFVHLSQNADVVMVQESVLNPLVEDTLKQLLGFNFNMATSFFLDDGTRTGVMTGSRSASSDVTFLRSPDTEPIAGTPKMTLLEKFKVEGMSDLLLVVNVHAINFTFNPAFERQIHQIIRNIRHHRGPVVLAGDFNTWHEGRREILEEAATSIGLQNILVPNDSRFLELDHIFVRGIKVHTMEILDQITTSDHYPLRAQLEVVPPAVELVRP